MLKCFVNNSYVNVGRPFRSFVHLFNSGISQLPASSDVLVPSLMDVLNLEFFKLKYLQYR